MSRFAKILLLMVLVDTGLTAAGVSLGHLEEANPIMAWCFAVGGPALFVAVKIGITILGITFIEFAARRRLISARRIKFYYLLAIGVYCAIYVSSVIAIHF